jgi:hypothetical protein
VLFGVISLVMPNASQINGLERTIADLVQERQRLRAEGAAAGELERNRREIVARQQELSDALIARYAPRVAFAAA